ncbi:MAG: ATP-binding protein, partial [Nostoc sp.]
YEYLKKLVEELGGEHVDLKIDEVKPLIDLYSIYQQRDNYQLNDEQLLEFSQPITRSNPLLLEILSNPSGQIDGDTIEGEELLNDFLNPSMTQETDDSDDLSELYN